MAEQTVTPFNERFADIMSGLLFDVLKAAGVTMQPAKAFERIRDTGRRMALTIEFHAERKAIDVAKKLQGEVVKAFKAMEEDMAKQEKITRAWVKRVRALERQIEELKNASTTSGSDRGESSEPVQGSSETETELDSMRG